MRVFVVVVVTALAMTPRSGETPEKSDDDAGFTAM
jgi:hypothetical protein